MTYTLVGHMALVLRVNVLKSRDLYVLKITTQSHSTDTYWARQEARKMLLYLIKYQAMSGGIAPHIFNLITRWQ